MRDILELEEVSVIPEGTLYSMKHMEQNSSETVTESEVDTFKHINTFNRSTYTVMSISLIIRDPMIHNPKGC